MATETAESVNGVPIRLTDERWEHIEGNHPNMAGYRDDCLDVVENPDLVLRGYGGALVAVKGYGRRGYLIVVYKEVSQQDSFIISARFVSTINRRNVVWRP